MPPSSLLPASSLLPVLFIGWIWLEAWKSPTWGSREIKPAEVSPLPRGAGQGQSRTLGPDQCRTGSAEMKVQWWRSIGVVAERFTDDRMLEDSEVFVPSGGGEGGKGIPGRRTCTDGGPAAGTAASTCSIAGGSETLQGCLWSCSCPSSFCLRSHFPRVLSPIHVLIYDWHDFDTGESLGGQLCTPNILKTHCLLHRTHVLSQCSHLGCVTSPRQQQLRADVSYLWCLGPIAPPGLWWRCRFLGGDRAVLVSDFQRLSPSPECWHSVMLLEYVSHIPLLWNSFFMMTEDIVGTLLWKISSMHKSRLNVQTTQLHWWPSRSVFKWCYPEIVSFTSLIRVS